MDIETKQIDPCALASLTTGIVLCEQGFGVVAEAAEWLLGHPVWTHEYIDPEIQRAMIEAVLAQYPTMPVEQPDDWRGLIAQLRAEFGGTVPVVRGSRNRDRNPMETLQTVMERKSS